MRKAITEAVASEPNTAHPGLGGPRQLAASVVKGNSILASDDPKSVNVQGLTKLLWNQTQVSDGPYSILNTHSDAAYCHPPTHAHMYTHKHAQHFTQVTLTNCLYEQKWVDLTTSKLSNQVTAEQADHAPSLTSKTETTNTPKVL